jgi:Zn-dependent M28 family amino/carboxypeptidase
LLFAGLILILPLRPEMATPALVMGGLVLIAGVPLWFLDLGDDSPGAIDNASSVGVVMELAQSLAKNPEVCRKIDLTILLTSAEEVSTMGAVAYNSGRLYVLNLEGVGVDGSLRWVGKGERASSNSEPCLLYLVHQACIDLGFEIRSFHLPGALTDHLPFTGLGLDAGTLMAVSRASLGVHTRRDSPDQLDLRGFEQAGQVVLKVIQAAIGSTKPETG